MKAGDLDQRIEIRALVTAKNDLNEDVRTWPASDPPHMRSAAAKEAQGREFVKGAAEITQRLVAFKIRWTLAVDSQCRVLWDGSIFEIADMTGTRRSGETWLHCRSVES